MKRGQNQWAFGLTPPHTVWNHRLVADWLGFMKPAPPGEYICIFIMSSDR